MNRHPRFRLSAAAGWLGLIASLLMLCRPLSGAEIEASLAGQLLVATEEMADPRFVETVIYIVKHDSEGALGLVVNRPLAKGPIDDLLKSFGANETQSQREVVIHYGGPVNSLQGFVLHSDDVTMENSIIVKGGLSMTSDIKLLEAIASGKGPKQFLIMLGYAGWAPGQLEAEIKHHAWFVVSADTSLIFGNNAENKWHQAMDRRRTPL